MKVWRWGGACLGDVEGGSDGDNIGAWVALCDCDMNVGGMDRFSNTSQVSCLWSLMVFTCFFMFSPSPMVRVMKLWPKLSYRDSWHLRRNVPSQMKGFE